MFYTRHLTTEVPKSFSVVNSVNSVNSVDKLLCSVNKLVHSVDQTQHMQMDICRFCHCISCHQYLLINVPIYPVFSVVSIVVVVSCMRNPSTVLCSYWGCVLFVIIVSTCCCCCCCCCCFTMYIVVVNVSCMRNPSTALFSFLHSQFPPFCLNHPVCANWWPV